MTEPSRLPPIEEVGVHSAGQEWLPTLGASEVQLQMLEAQKHMRAAYECMQRLELIISGIYPREGKK
jgi:hypothetical protein